MSKPAPPVRHDSNPFQDLSGVSTEAFANPYDALIEACNDDAKKIQAKYTAHRTTRNAQQKAKMLSEDFEGVIIDPILKNLEDEEPDFVDPRHCLVFWGRPTSAVKTLIGRVQKELQSVAPNLWLMPQDNLHITAMEMTHSKTAKEIQHLVNCMMHSIPSIVSHTLAHRTRLIKPMISYDASAIALSWVPAAGECLPSGRTAEDDAFTYHHLRRDLHHLCTQTGVAVDSRYVVPSSHLTIGRFIEKEDFEESDEEEEDSDDDDDEEEKDVDHEKVARLIAKIEQLNAFLEKEYWPKADGKIKEGGEWLVGEEKGLDCRMGTLWYGEGESVKAGEGF